MGLLKLVIMQVLVAALLLVSCAAFTKKYPDPLNCHNYYLRIDDRFYNLTCPNNLVFDQVMQQCTVKVCEYPDITPLDAKACSQTKEGYYCNNYSIFTYCTHDGLKIVDNASCPTGLFCRGQHNTKACVL